MRGQIGFIGLGTLGSVAAGRLASQGCDLLVWNRTPRKAEELHLESASCAAEVITRTQVVFLCLRDSEAVWAVTSGQQGLFAGECRGRTVIDLSTNHFEVATVMHGLAAKAGASWLEAPVLGSVIPASRGELTVLVSGEEEVFHRTRFLLEKIGSRLIYLGEPGLATKMKLANNMVLAATLAALAEATALGEAFGLPRQQVLEILGAGAGNSVVLATKREKILAEDFTPHFSVALLHKDLHYLQDLARVMRRPLFMAGPVKELNALAFPKGLEERDISVIYRILKDLGRPEGPP